MDLKKRGLPVATLTQGKVKLYEIESVRTNATGQLANNSVFVVVDFIYIQ